MNAAVFFSVLGYIIIGLVFGFLSNSLAGHKGYNVYACKDFFWLGFFLQILGLIYVSGLPKSKDLVLEEQKQLAALIAKAVIYKPKDE